MRHLQTNPLTGDTHQTTLEQDIQRARQCQPWLGTTWIYEVSGLARLIHADRDRPSSPMKRLRGKK